MAMFIMCSVVGPAMLPLLLTSNTCWTAWLVPIATECVMTSCGSVPVCQGTTGTSPAPSSSNSLPAAKHDLFQVNTTSVVGCADFITQFGQAKQAHIFPYISRVYPAALHML